jgi:uncharacterized protein (TIGR02118 family)
MDRRLGPVPAMCVLAEFGSANTRRNAGPPGRGRLGRPGAVDAIYAPPADPATFDKHYDEVHAPLATQFPGLRSFTIHRPAPGANGSPPAAHLVAVLTFDSEDALNAALSGPEGQAAVADLDNFAQAGVTILTGPVDVVV